MEAVAPVERIASRTELNTGTPNFRSPLAGRHAADHAGAIGQHLCGVKGADPPGDALHDDFGFRIEQDAHDLASAICLG